MKKIKLFCFSHSGASAIRFYRWMKHINKSIQIIPVDIPGRGERANEPLISTMDELIKDVYQYLLDKDFLSDDTLFALYGHSLGAIISYELYYYLMQKKSWKPVHLFLSGKYPFHLANKDYYYSITNLSNQEFVSELFKAGGIKKQFTEQFIDMFVPILRNDLKVVENYFDRPRDQKIKSQVTVFYGKHDYHFEIKKEDALFIPQIMNEWDHYFQQPASYYSFEGGHFFIDKYEKETINIINNKIGSL